jgi:hypothetical protein
VRINKLLVIAVTLGLLVVIMAPAAQGWRLFRIDTKSEVYFVGRWWAEKDWLSIDFRSLKDFGSLL